PVELELTSQRLEEVLARITTGLQEGRAQIQAMADEARMEEARLTRRLQELQLQLQRIADQVDRAAQEAYRARHRLMVVNREFSLYTEDEIRQAYQEAQEAQLALATYQERERLLRQQRDEQELTVRTVRQLAERADVLVAQVSVALDFLQGNLEAMSGQLQDLRARQEMGRRVIASVEEERRRLAREIHDGPAQALANLAFRAEICQRLVQALFPEKGGAGDAPSGASPGTLSEELERIREG